jgi:hypothetical protein
MKKLLLASFALLCALDLAQAQPARIADRDIVDAYEYMLGRLLVLRQEALDLREGFKWNEIIHREPGGVTWANPNLDVAYSEAWIALDETSCTLVDLPEIKNRYYTMQVLNGWGEVTANINERNYPKHAFGKFMLCIKPAKITLPKGVIRIDLPSRKSRVLFRIELGANPAEALALQKRVTMKAMGSPKIDKAVVAPDFPNTRLPGVEAFDKADEIVESEDDINIGMVGVQETASAVQAAIADPKERARIDDLIKKRAIPSFLGEIPKLGKAVNGWLRPPVIGNYRSDYLTRSIVNYAGIWANTSREVVYFTGQNIDGSLTYTQTYPADALPASKAKYFWSVVAVDGTDFHVIANPLNRHVFNKQSALKFNDDGSLTLVFAPKLPPDTPESNWMPTPQGKRYNLTYRFYGPPKDVIGGTYAPPPLVQVKPDTPPSRLRQLLQRN